MFIMNEYFNPDMKILKVERQRLGRYWNIPDLSAPYWRLYWNEDKGASVWLNKKEYPLLADEMTLIPPNTHFSSVNRESPMHFYVHFTAGPPFDGISAQIIRICPGTEILGKVRQVSGVLDDGKADPVKLSMEVMMLILYCLGYVPDKCIRQRKIDPRISTAMRMIEEELAAPPSNSAIAGKLCMSTNAFLRLFRQNAGVSPQLYSRNKRIDKACILLHYSDLDIKQIAAETGFCDRFHFSRVFRKLRGSGPAEFRKMTS
ncbi:MAG TPA: hypothetical protein DCZ94_06355 [Lentisphaeria bacterium]|nr:MAG: hypothetical protein A2X48_05760 [Lentisphaerae bacterium GWF2_49_21]HBC86559.1 hypothetical protein [Lentisphaeria bacterium]